MPRDLKAMADGPASPEQESPQITRSPEAFDDGGMFREQTLEDILAQRNDKRDGLHPYTQTLKLSDIESCMKLEELTFPPNERFTREKFQYRLTKCGELSLGIFTSDAEGNIPTAETSAPVYSGAPERKAVLLGHIVATKTTNQTVRDEDMDIPTGDSVDPKVGHKEEGGTICIHSLAVLPDFQGRGLGKTLMKAYIQRMETQAVGVRLALIAHEALIPFYESLGFANKGKSDATFAGGGWFDMVRELRTAQDLVEEEEELE